MEALNARIRGLVHISWAVVLRVDVMEPSGCKKEPGEWGVHGWLRQLSFRLLISKL